MLCNILDFKMNVEGLGPYHTDLNQTNVVNYKTLIDKIVQNLLFHCTLFLIVSQLK
jgi:large-conductance mechanosensitive channel